jgi:chromosome partitioning protein
MVIAGSPGLGASGRLWGGCAGTGSHLRGLKTLVADIDPQGSASEVLSARGPAAPHLVRTDGPGLFAAQLGAVASDMDVMVIDTAAGAIEEVGQAIVLADVSLLVVRPTLLDLAATVRTVDIIRRLRKPALVVMNQAPPARDGVEAPTVKRAMKALAFMRLPVAPTILRTRAIYQTALETGRSAEETLDVSATREITELWAFVERFTFGARKACPPIEVGE